MKTNKRALAMALGSICVLGSAPAHAVKVAGDLLEVYGNLYPEELRTKYSTGDGGTVSQLTTGRLALATQAPGTARPGMTKLAWSQSYVGFKGQKKVKNNLNVGYDLQAVVTPDDTDATLFPRTRDAFVFVSHESVGTFSFGSMDTPYKAMGDRYRMLGISSSNVVSTSNVLSQPGWRGGTTSFHTRTANQLQYTTPRIAGVEASIGYSNNPNNVIAAGSVQGTRLIAYGVNWTQGPFYVSAQREEHRNYMPFSTGKTPSATVTIANSSALNVFTNGGASDDNAMRVSFGFEQSGLRVGADVSRLYYSEENAGLAGKFHSYKETTYQVSAEYDVMADLTVAGGYAQGLKGNCSLSGGATCSVVGLGGKMYSLGAMYKLDRGIGVFALLNQYNNNPGSSYGSPAGVTVGGKVTNFALGVQVRF